MKIVRSISALRKALGGSSHPRVCVPTMGALHKGHLELLKKGRVLANQGTKGTQKTKGTLVATIFVNPTQFGPKEDLSRYPRPFERDAKLCKEAGVDVLFAPETVGFYPADFSTWVEETALQNVLCGKSRPGHFRGVCTVVAKLFHVVQPDVAVFGQKDFQQLAIIRRMVRDLDFPIRIVGVPTVREADGLALSSRNAYLTPEERAQAPVLRRALLKAKTLSEQKPAAIRNAVVKMIRTAPLARVDYVEIVDAETLAPVGPKTGERLIAVAVFFGRTRLIDNLLLPRQAP